MVDSYKKWSILFAAVFGSLMIFTGGITFVIDPYFHYHKPLKSLAYPISDERYQNNGIVKNFDYDALITGTSKTENFKTSEFDELFGVNSVKVPFSGASYKEINDNLKVALKHNKNLRMVLRGLEYEGIISHANYMRYAEDMYPYYLYDDNPFNDVSYLFNKEVLLGVTKGVIDYTRSGGRTTSFDEYKNWMEGSAFGRDAVLSNYERPAGSDTVLQITESDYHKIRDNLEQNVISLAKQYPEADFYYFFTPDSILSIDKINQEGDLDRQLQAEKYAIELMLPYQNIHLFSFRLHEELICNLDYYKDYVHYHEDVNSMILQWIHDGVGELTPENYQAYCDQEAELYKNFDYDSLFD